ncbi:MAG: hypothetical protein R2880_08010 [Deinococcales bacterium]
MSSVEILGIEGEEIPDGEEIDLGDDGSEMDLSLTTPGQKGYV